MSKQNYYSVQNILQENADYNMLLGERSNGKSYSVKHQCIDDYVKKQFGFIYLRRYTVEIKNFMVNAYFNDVDVKKATNGRWEAIDVYRSGIYLCNFVEGKLVREVQCGLVMALSTATHYKSMSLLEFKNVIFEEFITDELYLDNEPAKLQQLISTIARRERIRVFLIGNTISRLCPYFNEWQLIHIPKQKQGTIDIYNMTTDQIEDGKPVVVKIAVELCENSGNNSKMFFGVRSKAITSGTWESDVQPHIPYPYKECQKLYTFTVIKFNMTYMCEILKHEKEMFIFVHPTNKITTNRIIQEEYSPNMLVTQRLIVLTKGDDIAIKLIRMNKLCFSDNLTGSEFKSNVLPTL